MGNERQINPVLKNGSGIKCFFLLISCPIIFALALFSFYFCIFFSAFFSFSRPSFISFIYVYIFMCCLICRSVWFGHVWFKISQDRRQIQLSVCTEGFIFLHKTHRKMSMQILNNNILGFETRKT